MDRESAVLPVSGLCLVRFEGTFDLNVVVEGRGERRTLRKEGAVKTEKKVKMKDKDQVQVLICKRRERRARERERERERGREGEDR
jgi:triosephosphate isomerase